MLLRKKQISYLICMILGFHTLAQTTSNTNNPDWDNGGDWSGDAPGYDMQRSAILANNSNISDPITVNDGYTLTINAGVTLTTNEVITVKEGGTLIINGNLVGTDGGKEFKVEKGTFLVNSGGSFDWAGYWTSNDNPATITINGNMNVDGDLTNSVTIDGSGTLTVGGTVENNGTIGGSTGNDTGTLPIELTDFQASTNEKGIRIHWTSATEINNEFYSLERSYDGSDWISVTELPGAGNSSEPITYEFFDLPPAFGRIYYRLTQTDYDGTSETFQFITVLFENPEDDRVKVFPSLITPEVQQIQISNIWGEILSHDIAIYDLQGRNSKTDISAIDPAFITIPMDKALNGGLYVLKGQVNGVTFSQKIVIRQ